MNPDGCQVPKHSSSDRATRVMTTSRSSQSLSHALEKKASFATARTSSPWSSVDVPVGTTPHRASEIMLSGILDGGLCDPQGLYSRNPSLSGRWASLSLIERVLNPRLVGPPRWPSEQLGGVAGQGRG